MPIDPNMPDSVMPSPQQLGITQQIAQGVANSAGAAQPPATAPDFASAHPVVAGVGNVLLSALQGFASGVAGQDAVGQQLRAKYQQDLMQKELANKEKLAKDQAFQEFVQKGIGTAGSQFLSDPKLRKRIGIDDLPMYEAMGKAVDHQKAMIAQATKALGLPPEMANIPPDLVKAILQQQQMKQDKQLADQSNATTIRGQDKETERAKMGEGAAMARTRFEQEHEDARNKAEIEARLKIAGNEKQLAAYDKWTNDIGKQRDSLIQKYAATDSNGKQKFTDKQRQAATDAWNRSIDAKAKEFKERGLEGFDPEMYKLESEPSIEGSWFKWRKAEPGTLAPKVSDTATGVAAAPRALKASGGKPPFPGAIRTTYDGKPGWRDADKTRFVPDA